MNVEELEVRNKVYDLGLVKEDFDILKKELEKGGNGEVFLIRKNGKVFGIKHGGYDKGVIVDAGEDVPSLPYYRIAGLNLNFQLSSTDTESIEYFAEKALRTRNYGEHPFGENSTVTSMKEIKETILARILATHKDGYADIGNCDTSRSEYASGNKADQDQALSAWFWLFNEEVPEKFKNWQEMETEKDLSRIVKVWEKDNVRYALSIHKQENHSSLLSLRIFTPEQEEYNYVDENRLFLGNVFVWWDLNENEVEPEYLMRFEDGNVLVVVNKEAYQRMVRKFRLKVEKEKEETETKAHISKEFDERIRHLGTKPLVINGLKLTADKIEFEGHEISGRMEKTNKWAPNSVEAFIKEKVRNVEDLDFNNLFNQFCELLQEREFTGILGKIRVEIKKETIKKDNLTFLTRYLINGTRINKDEVVDVIKRAVCFDKAKDFNSLVQEVSKCSLKFHDMLSNGLNITFQDKTLYWAGSRATGDCVMKLNVVRKGSRNFLRVGTEEYKISDTNKLLTISDANKNRRDKPDFETIMKVLHEMFNLPTEKVGELIKEGMKEHFAAVKRSEEFLAETIKILKVEKVENGYLVRGKSGTEYLINEDLKITDHNSGKYICIVDKTLGQGFQNDRLVNRLYALANDTLVEISTLKR